MEDRSVHDSQSESNEPPSNKDKKNSTEPIQQNQPPTADRGAGELKPPPPNGNAAKAQKKRSYTRDPGMFWVSVAALIVVAIYAWYAREQAISMKDAAEAAGRSATAANRALEVAERSIAIAERQSRLDQRAWVSIKGNRVTSLSENSFQYMVDFRNTGKTPALKVRHGEVAVVVPKIGPENVKAVLKKHNKFTYRPFGSLPPSVDGSFYSNENITGFYKAVEAGKSFLVVIGDIQYETFGTVHHSRFCYFLPSTKSNTMAMCPGGNGNEMD